MLNPLRRTPILLRLLSQGLILLRLILLGLILRGLTGLPSAISLGLILLGLRLVQNPLIVLGVLLIVFNQNPVSTDTCIKRQARIFLRQLSRCTPQATSRAVAVKCAVGILGTITPAAIGTSYVIVVRTRPGPLAIAMSHYQRYFHCCDDCAISIAYVQSAPQLGLIKKPEQSHLLPCLTLVPDVFVKRAVFTSTARLLLMTLDGTFTLSNSKVNLFGC